MIEYSHPEATAAIMVLGVRRTLEAFQVEETKIRFWHDEECQDWHVEINGRRHMHVTSQSMEDLVEAAVIRAENVIDQAMLRGLGRPN